MKLKEFAQELGLSPTTISRALGGYPEVSEATREKVREAANRLGYRPNANAVRLVTGRAGAIGVIMGRNGAGTQFAEFMGGMAERLEREDIDILVSLTAENDLTQELNIYKRLATSGRVDAIIIHSPSPNDERIALLQDLRIPFIVHGRCKTSTNHAWLDIDNHGVTHRATSHLLGLGHRRIALINGPSGKTFSGDREDGYCDALKERGIAVDRRMIFNGVFTDETSFQFTRSLLEQTPRPTAFVAGAMMTALGVYRAIRSLGMSIGRDVSVISHDDVFPFLTPESMMPPLSTTRSSIRMAGARVTDLLLQMIAGRGAEDINELWPIELVLRESTGPAPE
jgi:LacI family transcriptional regulator